MHQPDTTTKKYDLRWRFDFNGNRPAVYGKWSAPGSTPQVQAWNKNREGLVLASIEAREVGTNREFKILSVDGHDFVNFQWVAVAMVPYTLAGKVQPRHALAGLKIVARDVEYVVFADGTGEKRIRPEAEKTINFATFGR